MGDEYKPNLDGMIAPEQVEAAEKRMVAGYPDNPSLLAKLNPANWPDSTKAKLKSAGVAALKAAVVAGATALGIKYEIVTTILNQILGG